MSENNDGYKVGYKKPPLASRFVKGRSGNPKGRPRGSKNLSSVIERRLSRKIPMVVNGRTEMITVVEAVLMQTIKKAISGDARASKLVLDLYKDLPEPTEPQKGFNIFFEAGDEKL